MIILKNDGNAGTDWSTLFVKHRVDDLFEFQIKDKDQMTCIQLSPDNARFLAEQILAALDDEQDERGSLLVGEDY